MVTAIQCSARYQFLIIETTLNHLLIEQTRCTYTVFKQTHLCKMFQSGKLANREKLWGLLSNIMTCSKRNRLEDWLFCWLVSRAWVKLKSYSIKYKRNGLAIWLVSSAITWWLWTHLCMHIDILCKVAKTGLGRITSCK